MIKFIKPAIDAPRIRQRFELLQHGVALDDRGKPVGNEELIGRFDVEIVSMSVDAGETVRFEVVVIEQRKLSAVKFSARDQAKASPMDRALSFALRKAARLRRKPKP